MKSRVKTVTSCGCTMYIYIQSPKFIIWNLIYGRMDTQINIKGGGGGDRGVGFSITMEFTKH